MADDRVKSRHRRIAFHGLAGLAKSSGPLLLSTTLGEEEQLLLKYLLRLSRYN